MTRIFISHSHMDEAIAYKLFDFLICVFPELRDEDILCTSDPNSGLSFNSNTISDQLKRNLKGAEALVALITTDSLRSLWIPFEIGSFWPTEKPIVLILGPSLSPSKLPGPLKGWLSIRIEDDQAFDQINAVTNQLEKKLGIRQNVNRRRRDRHLNGFITQFQAWKSKLPEPDISQQKEIEELKAQIQDKERSHKDQLKEVQALSQQEKEKLEVAFQQEKEELEQSFRSEIRQLEQQLYESQTQIETDQNEIIRLQEILKEQEKLVERSRKQELEKKEAEPSQAQSFIEKLGNGVELEMIAIPGGKFMMGSPEGEGFNSEKPQHEVTVQAFYMGKYPITQAQYKQIMGNNPSYFKGDDQRPVEKVSWDDAVEFCQKLSKQTEKVYRLPSEAEWEYACRAGTTTAYYFGDGITSDFANHKENVGRTTPVYKYPPNAFGLYDMHGNVWEWCQNTWDGSARLSGDSTKKLGRLHLSSRGPKVLRGGSWLDGPRNGSSAYRDRDFPGYMSSYIGLRVVCVAPSAT